MQERHDLTVPAGLVGLFGTLTVPDDALGVVLFAHGSGSSRLSPRNRHVAAALNARGLATLLFDLLTDEEERIDAIDARFRFDIELLATRLVAATDWLAVHAPLRGLSLGYFGASTGAAAALVAAARRPNLVDAIVSRGGRPDLAGPFLDHVSAPTLLIVGGADPHVLALNRQAAAHLADHELTIVPGATHLFSEPGTLDEVARLAGDWLLGHLQPLEAQPLHAH